MIFSITFEHQEFKFELCHSRDWSYINPEAGFFWACEDPDEESYPKYFATEAACMQHAMQWVRDTVRAEEIELEELALDADERKYGSYEDQNRLSGRQLGVE